MNARTRADRRTIRQRATQTRAAARIARRGDGSLVTHGIAAGLTKTEATTVAGSLRKAARKLDIIGAEARVHAGRRMRTTHRYTPAEVARMAAVYRPRRAEFKTARAFLLAA